MAATAAVALIMGGAGVMLSRPDASVPSGTVTTVPRATTQVKGTRIIPEATPSSTTPKWFRASQSSWASDGSRTVTFELQAEKDVPVWMTRVRPSLAVRCLGRDIEVYVVTSTAASLEPTPDAHSVRIGFDDQTDVEQHWLDSASHRELFSPNGMSLANYIAHADKMRFSFTPFNSSPVTAEFDVHGFLPSFEIVQKTCRNDAKREVRRDVRKENIATK